MPNTINIYDAKTHLSALVEKAARGEEIVIAKAGKPMAKLVPLVQKVQEPRKFGQNLLGINYLAPNYNAPLSDDIPDDIPDDIIDAFYDGPVFPPDKPAKHKPRK